MKRELAHALYDIMFDRDEDENIAVYEEYSGRNMYNETTAGIVCDCVGTLFQAIIENADKLVDTNGRALFKDISQFRTDNMGHQTIIY